MNGKPNTQMVHAEHEPNDASPATLFASIYKTFKKSSIRSSLAAKTWNGRFSIQSDLKCRFRTISQVNIPANYNEP
jgi:hypothetical protein